MHGGDGLDGVVEAGSFLAAVAENLPGLHAGEGVLDAGPDVSVFGVVFLLGPQQGAFGSLAVRDDEANSQVSTVGEDGGAFAVRGQFESQFRFCSGFTTLLDWWIEITRW